MTQFLDYSQYFSGNVKCGITLSNAGNMGFRSDEPAEYVIGKREKFFNTIDLKYNKIYTPIQIHSNRVVCTDNGSENEECDAVFTIRKNIILTICTADCYPIFIGDKASSGIALIHSGWRGFISGIIDNTIKLMIKKTGIKKDSLIIYIGPGIGKCCFEVGEDVYKLFSDKYQHKKNNNCYVDLNKAIHEKLINFGINKSQIFSSGECTVCNTNKYFSYRRTSGEYSRMMSFMTIQ